MKSDNPTSNQHYQYQRMIDRVTMAILFLIWNYIVWTVILPATAEQFVIDHRIPMLLAAQLFYVVILPFGIFVLYAFIFKAIPVLWDEFVNWITGR